MNIKNAQSLDAKRAPNVDDKLARVRSTSNSKQHVFALSAACRDDDGSFAFNILQIGKFPSF